MKKKIVIGSDHGGYEYKEKLSAYLKGLGYEVINVGCDSAESCDYPDYAKKVCKEVLKNKCLGIVLCGTGIGISIVVNKVKGIRCGIAYTDEVAALMRQHNNANVIAFGGRFMKYKDIEKRTEIFINTGFEGGRHLRRIKKIEK